MIPVTENTDRVERIAAYACELAASEVPTVLIAGCGRGYTLERLIGLDIDAYGFDPSRRAVETAAVPEHVTRVSIRDPNAAHSAAFRLGIDPEGIDLLVTETVLSTLRPEEAKMACRRLREVAPLAHFVHPLHDESASHAHEALALAEWKRLCDPEHQDHWRLAV